MQYDNECCKICIRWDPDKKECHRYPPTVIYKGNGNGTGVVFPNTTEDEWCGEFTEDVNLPDEEEE